jgi:superfamily I DNA/RNA helicase
LKSKHVSDLQGLINRFGIAKMSFEFHLPSLEEMRSTPDGMAMLRMIDDDNFRSALITGCPGSGKTTVAIYRLVRINNQQVGINLVTYQNMLVLAIRNLANVRSVGAQNICTFHEWYCGQTNSNFLVETPPTKKQMEDCLNKSSLANRQLTEILIDEGQDLPISVYETLPRYFSRFLVSADNGQQVHPNHGAHIEEIESTLRNSCGQYRRFALGRNFRNTFETYAFARQFIPRTNLTAWDPAILDRLHHSGRHGPKPKIISYHDVARRNDHLRTTLKNAEGNVAILCPLGPLPNKPIGESVDNVFDIVLQMGISASKYHYKSGTPAILERYVVTTFKSAKGLEFDVVIIPRINFFKFIPEEWYVACTRAKRELFVYRDLSRPECDPICDFDHRTYIGESLNDETPASAPDFPF